MLKKGDELLWLSLDMPGEIVEVREDGIRAAWKAGYDSPFSGGTFWGAGKLIEAGCVELVGDNGHKPKTPKTLIDPTGRDLFKEAFQMRFEL